MAELLPDWLVLLVGVTGIIGGLGMLVRWLVTTVKSSWQSNGRVSNGASPPAPVKPCALDSGFVTSQLTNCEASREQAAMRDQQMLVLTQQILSELQAIRAQQQEILEGIAILLERSR